MFSVETAGIAGLFLAAATAACRRVFQVGLQTPRVFGGVNTRMQKILLRIPLLSVCPELKLPSALQLVIYAFQMMWQEWYFDSTYATDVETFPVTLPGDSTEGCADHVRVTWVHGRKGCKRALPPDAPIILLTPGLNCYSANLPGTAVYAKLLEQPWRIAVFEKRGVGGKCSNVPESSRFPYVWASIRPSCGHPTSGSTMAESSVAFAWHVEWQRISIQLLGSAWSRSAKSPFLLVFNWGRRLQHCICTSQRRLVVANRIRQGINCIKQRANAMQKRRRSAGA